MDRLAFYLGNVKADPVTLPPFDPPKVFLQLSKSVNFPCYVLGGDVMEKVPSYFVVKNRWHGVKDSVIIRSINFNRHWGPYYNRPPDTPFLSKIRKVIWRGGPTGSKPAGRPATRLMLVSKWANKHPDIDVMFTKVTIKRPQNDTLPDRVTIPHMLGYKYIVSAEGNDKDSGLQWKLNSNSVVMMARPRCTSWLMETTLVPNMHYVLLKDDFSDLLDKFKWCEANPEKCLQIIKNANTFMAQFKDNEAEQKLEIRVLQEYAKLMASKKLADPPKLATKLALVIASNYPKSSAQLFGCINDAAAMKTLLAARGYEVKMLTDDTSPPTRQNILSALRTTLKTAPEGSRIFLHYSGHGNLVPGKYEKDNIIYPCNMLPIRDDLLKQIIRNNLRPSMSMFAIFDACYSGTMLDLKYNYLGTDNQPVVDSTKDETRGQVIMLSGCSDRQTSEDAYFNGGYNGAMTRAFLKCYPNVSYRQLLQNIRAFLTQRKFTQTPQLQAGRPLSLDDSFVF